MNEDKPEVITINRQAKDTMEALMLKAAPVNLKAILHYALVRKNKQAYRIVAGTKAGRQHISANCTSNGVIVRKDNLNKLVGRGS